MTILDEIERRFKDGGASHMLWSDFKYLIDEARAMSLCVDVIARCVDGLKGVVERQRCNCKTDSNPAGDGNPCAACVVADVCRRLRDVTEARLDRQTQALRDAVSKWAVERGLGFSGGWVVNERLWRYTLDDITVEISESGADAWVNNTPVTQTKPPTPKRLRLSLTKAWSPRRV